MAVAKKTPSSRSGRRGTTSSGSPVTVLKPNSPEDVGRIVLVRMYNVGFGDCFLIEAPVENDFLLRILIDCGSIAASASLEMSDVVETLLSDVMDEDGTPRIDIVVCTHRHADHVSGFSRAAWKDLRVKEVWFPWTEDPTDDAAKHIRETQSRLAAALQAHWRARLAANADDADAHRWLDLSINALSNEAAMSMLHSGFRSKPKRRFLSSDGAPTPIETDALANVTAFVLGPSKDEAIVRDMNPPSGTTYLRQIAGDQPAGQPFEPFADDWVIDPPSFQWTNLIVDVSDQDAMREAAQAWNPAVSVALEQAVNGTSLVLVFEIDDVVLFFPGDAQWGTWNAFLKNPKSIELLSRAKFWKVGHHGSHNATPIDFVVKTATKACCAMMSTRTGKFTSIPRMPLVDAINSKGIPLARSDEPEKAPATPFWRRTASIIEAKIPIGGPK